MVKKKRRDEKRWSLARIHNSVFQVVEDLVFQGKIFLREGDCSPKIITISSHSVRIIFSKLYFKVSSPDM